MPLVGVFVGGASRRMGRPKGLLEAPGGGSLVARILAIAGELGLESVLVGDRAEYRALRVPTLPDAADGAGPLGGLVSLLEHAAGGSVIALACDLPYLERSIVDRLVRAPDGVIVAPRRDGRWEPLLARYDATVVLPIARAHLDRGELALQRLLDAAGAVELSIAPSEQRMLVDWDTPEDTT